MTAKWLTGGWTAVCQEAVTGLKEATDKLDVGKAA